MWIAALAMTGRIILLGFERIVFKQAGEKKNSLIATFWLFSLAAVLQLPLLFFFPFHAKDFLNATISAAIYTVTFSIYVYVLSNYEVSLVTPFYNFNVFFLLILSVIFLHESFSWLKLLGIALLFYGTTFLNKKHTFLESIKAVYKNRGCILMIIASFLMAIGRIIDRSMIKETPPAIYSFALYAWMGIYLGIWLLIHKQGEETIQVFKERPKSFLLGGAINAYSYLLLLIAFLEIEVSVAEPLSMLSVLLTIILSGLIFKEKIKDRLIGGAVMVLGAILLVLLI
ncbi:MAG: DMT family transporter [Promethearchaeota archaeon]